MSNNSAAPYTHQMSVIVHDSMSEAEMVAVAESGEWGKTGTTLSKTRAAMTDELRKKIITIFSRVHATLHPALSVRPSVGLSVTLLLFLSILFP